MVKQVKVENITPYEKNAKKHPKKQIEQIARSIEAFGFNQPIVVDKENVIVVGHGRFEAAKKLGMKEVPCLQVDLNQDKVKAYRLADNKLNESDWEHGTQKPIECMLRPIKNNTSPGHAVYDPFGGSGTTLIACEKSGRQCFMMEIDPCYIDAIIERWQEYTNEKAVKVDG